MIAIRTRVTGLKELIAINERVMREFDNGTFTKAIAKKTKNRAKYRAPRKSGKLIRRINYKMEGPNSFTLTCDAVNEQGIAYPEILEFGLSRYIPIGRPDSPRIIVSGGGKIAFLPFLRWALWRTLLEKDKIFKKEIMKHYK